MTGFRREPPIESGVAVSISALYSSACGLLGDPSALLGDFSSLLPGAGANLAATLGQEFAVNLGSLLPQLATAFIPF